MPTHVASGEQMKPSGHGLVAPHPIPHSGGGSATLHTLVATTETCTREPSAIAWSRSAPLPGDAVGSFVMPGPIGSMAPVVPSIAPMPTGPPTDHSPPPPRSEKGTA